MANINLKRLSGNRHILTIDGQDYGGKFKDYKTGKDKINAVHGAGKIDVAQRNIALRLLEQLYGQPVPSQPTSKQSIVVRRLASSEYRHCHRYRSCNSKAVQVRFRGDNGHYCCVSRLCQNRADDSIRRGQAPNVLLSEIAPAAMVAAATQAEMMA